MKDLIIGITIIFFILSLLPAFADTGGPQIPQVNNTVTQYCWNGICQTPGGYMNPVLSNDTANQESKARYNIIMVIPSELCTRATSNHVKTNCPDIAAVKKYDNSNQNISGKFIQQIDGTWTRTNPEVKNHWQYYTNTNHTIICIYCNGNYVSSDLYQTIIIEPDIFEFVTHSFHTRTVTNYIQNGTGEFIPVTSTVNEQDASLKSYIGRNVQGCDTATISYSDFILNDTINYLESGCKITHYNQTNVRTVPNTPWQYDNPYSSLHYVDTIKNMFKGWKPGSNGTVISGIGLGNCINGCPYTTSTKKPGW